MNINVMGRSTARTMSLVLAASFLVATPLAVNPQAARAVPPPAGTLVSSVDGFGWTEGSFTVSHSGAAQYTVPLWMPAGRGNVAPELSLTYNSGGGNGPLGVGWSLSGLSNVSPCSRTMAQDGRSAAVRYDATDVYCLDGARLWPVAAHTGTQQEFRTERESFSKVVAFGAANAVPDYFKAWAKDGRTLHYGQTDASRLKAFQLSAGTTNPPTLVPSTSPVTASWALDRIEDRNGNAATIEYWKSGTGSAADLWAAEMHPSAISYGPNRRVEFGYFFRLDKENSFSGGVHTSLTQQMLTITMSGAPEGEQRQTLRKYTLGYENNSVTARSLLTTITECDMDNKCLRPLLFDWQRGGTQFSSVDTELTSMGTRIVTGDVNGDGREDLLHLDTCPPGGGCDRNLWSIRRSLATSPPSFGPHERANIPRGMPDDDYKNDVRPLDVNRDGRLDLMAEVNPTGTLPHGEYKLYTSNGTAYVAGTDLTPDHVSEVGIDPPYFLDMDGNGATDFVMPFSDNTGGGPAQRQYWYRLASSTDGSFGALTNSGLTTQFLSESRVKVLDHDGDGRASLLLPNAFGNPDHFFLFGLDDLGVPRLRKDSDAGVNIPFGSNADPRDLQLADVNGDGTADAVYVLSGLRTQLGTGRGFSSFIDGPAGYVLPPRNGAQDLGVRIADFTNDGADDVMLLLPGTPVDAEDRQRGVQLYTWRDNGFQRIRVNAPSGLEAGVFHDDTGMSSTQPLDIDGNGVLDMVRLTPATPTTPSALQILRRGEQPDLMISAQVLNGPQVRIGYTTLADSAVHTPATANCSYPRFCSGRGGVIVAEHSFATHINLSFDTYKHAYRGARSDLQGRGWLGFESHTVTRGVSGATTVTEFDNVTRDTTIVGYPYAHLPKRTTYTLRESGTGRFYKQESVHTNQIVTLGGRRHKVEMRRTVDTEQESANGTAWDLVRKRTIDVVYDGYGNQDLVTTAIDGGRRQIVDPAYTNDTSAWLIGQVNRELTTGCTAANTCLTRERTFGYDDRGNRNLEVVEPNRPELRLSTATGFGTFGQVTSIATTAENMPARSQTFEYENADKLYPTAVVNALGHRTSIRTHSGLGVRLGTTGPNPGQITEMDYDKFGRLRDTRRSDGGYERITHTPGITRQTVTTDFSGGGRTSVVTDRLGRTIEQHTKTFSGATAVSYTTYDTRSRPITVSRPALEGQPLHVTTTTYDQRDRPITIVEPPNPEEPEGATTRFTYRNRESHTYDARNIHSYTVKNVDGDLASSFEDDPDSTAWLETKFEYGPFGELRKVTAADNTVTTMEVDLLGKRKKLVDPNTGTTDNTYNAFGEVVTETNALQQVTTYTYDTLGRVLTITSPDGTHTNTWDTAPNGTGGLASALSADNVRVDHTYDSISRPAAKKWTIEGTEYQLDFGYDSVGRASTTEFPAIPGDPDAGRMKIVNGYNPNGYLSSVADSASSGRAYWTADTRNESGQLTRETLRNGVITTHQYQAETGLHTGTTVTGPTGVGLLSDITYGYDLSRNVDVRHDQTNQRYESYTYDALSRLRRWTVTAGPSPSLPKLIDSNYSYDKAGNLTEETTSLGQQQLPAIAYHHGENNAPPHLLTSRNNATFTYDAAGRQTGGDQRTITYNRLNLPKLLTWGQGQSTSFRYDPDGARVLKRDATRTSITLAGVFERRRHTGVGDTEVENIFNIMVEGRLVAQIERSQPSPTGPATEPRVRYVHTDQQGSSIKVTNASGRPVDGDAFLVNMFYDPFGRRIDAAFRPVDAQRHADPRQGYTGHYHDDEYGLINMKGRIYSPQNRRFLTPDPIVQDPYSSHSYNRYAYAWNNPATRTDPTGFSGCKDFGYLPECDVKAAEYPGPEQGNTDITDAVHDPWTKDSGAGSTLDDDTGQSQSKSTSDTPHGDVSIDDDTFAVAGEGLIGYDNFQGNLYIETQNGYYILYNGAPTPVEVPKWKWQHSRDLARTGEIYDASGKKDWTRIFPIIMLASFELQMLVLDIAPITISAWKLERPAAGMASRLTAVTPSASPAKGTRGPAGSFKPEVKVHDPDGPWTPAGRVSDANALRNAAGMPQTTGKLRAWSASINTKTGQIAVGCSGGGNCAETNILAHTGWNVSDVVFTRTFMYLKGVWDEIAMCRACQGIIPRTSRVPGMLVDP